MSTSRCSVCGSTGLNLVHGTYYCKECGTQDVDVQEAVIDDAPRADGTKAFVDKRKFTKIVKEGIEMSGEWYKWHAYNFILQGLADELMELGAKPSFKMKLVWVWVRYIKAFQNEAELGLNDENSEQKASKSLLSEEADEEDEADGVKKGENKKTKKQGNSNNLKVFTKEILLGLIYAALNLDGSDIQISHLFKFIREGKFSYYDCVKFIPKEIPTKLIPNWHSFVHGRSCGRIRPQNIREYAMSFFKILKLGTPVVPDLRLMVENFMKELCLPDYIKELVFSLMYLVPCNFLGMGHLIRKEFRVPDYEGQVMTYVLIAIKMVFGLDDDYEIRLSDEVERYNEANDFAKSYKLGGYVDKSDRLFSFREWCNYYKFRKLILSKYNFAIAQQFFLDVNDCVLMDYLEQSNKKNVSLLDKITMDIVDKIPQMDDDAVIPKSEFITTLTPLHTYTEVVTHYITDPELKLLLCEDFTQYSMDYLNLDNFDNFSNGVSMNKKIKSKTIVGDLLPSSNTCDKSMVFVINCENRNWLKTKPPSISHIKKIEKDDYNSSIIDKDSDYGNYSSRENAVVDNNSTISAESDSENNCDRILETIEEEDEDVLIFEGKLDDLKEEKVVDIEEPVQDQDGIFLNVDSTWNEEAQLQDNIDINDKTENDNNSEGSTIIIPQFDPITFDKEKTIKELVLSECKKYKIPVPKEYKDEIVTRKRKSMLLDDEANASEPKKRKTRAKPGEYQHEIDTIIASYFSAIQSDMVNEVSEHIKSVFEALDYTEEHMNPSENEMPYIDVSHTSERDEDVRSVNDNNQSRFMVVDHTINDKSEDENALQGIISKNDPNFDEKMYDIKQLYVKFKEEINLGDISDIEDDPEVEKIIDAKIDQLDNIVNGTTEKLDAPIIATDVSVELNKVSDTDSVLEADLPPSAIQNQLVRTEEKLKTPLLKNATRLNHYHYWFRHYTTNQIVKCTELTQPFNLELLNNYPNSFTFVLRECASIVECTPFAMYKNLQCLEPLLLDKMDNLWNRHKILSIFRKGFSAVRNTHQKKRTAPQRPVLRFPHPMVSRDLHQVVSPPCSGPTHAASFGSWSSKEKDRATTTGPTLPASNAHDLDQVVSPPCSGPTHAASSGSWSSKGKDRATTTDPTLPASNAHDLHQVVSPPCSGPTHAASSGSWSSKGKDRATTTDPTLLASNAHDLHQVVSPPCSGPTHAASSGSWSSKEKDRATTTGPTLPASNAHDLHQVVSPPFSGPTHAASSGSWSSKGKDRATTTDPTLPASNAHDLHQVVSPPCSGPTHAASSGSWSSKEKDRATTTGPTLPASNAHDLHQVVSPPCSGPTHAASSGSWSSKGKDRATTTDPTLPASNAHDLHQVVSPPCSGPTHAASSGSWSSKEKDRATTTGPTLPASNAHDLHQVVSPPCSGPTHAASSGSWSPLVNSSRINPTKSK